MVNCRNANGRSQEVLLGLLPVSLRLLIFLLLFILDYGRQLGRQLVLKRLSGKLGDYELNNQQEVAMDLT